MPSWPPAVLLVAKQDIMRHMLRDMIRKCGVEDVELRSGSEEAYEAVRQQTKRWQVFVMERSLPGALEAVRKIRGEFGPLPRVILIVPGPTREEVLEAVQAGGTTFSPIPSRRRRSRKSSTSSPFSSAPPAGASRRRISRCSHESLGRLAAAIPANLPIRTGSWARGALF